MSDLVADVGKIAEELAKTGSVTVSMLTKIAEQISKGFGVKADEVALLAVVQQDRFLKFLIPEKLQQVGNLPMTSTNSLAVRTARDKRPEIVNNFTIARHQTVFEGVPLSQQRGDPIQKIMSAPISADNKVVGVIQVSRKGKTLAGAGPDFAPKDLTELVALGNALGKCIKLATAGS